MLAVGFISAYFKGQEAAEVIFLPIFYCLYTWHNILMASLIQTVIWHDVYPRTFFVVTNTFNQPREHKQAINSSMLLLGVADY